MDDRNLLYSLALCFCYTARLALFLIVCFDTRRERLGRVHSIKRHQGVCRVLEYVHSENERNHFCQLRSLSGEIEEHEDDDQNYGQTKIHMSVSVQAITFVSVAIATYVCT